MDKSILNKHYQQAQPNILADVCSKAATMTNVIDLSIGDPDFTTPSPIIEEVMYKAHQGMTHYTDTRGMGSLRAAICNYYAQRYHLCFDRNEVLITTGAEHGMYILLQAILNPGDEVIIPEPCFSPYIDQVKMAGGRPCLVATGKDNGFKISISAISQAITNRTKAIIINSPNNPTGNVLTNSELQSLTKLAEQHDLLLISDEIYADYVMPGHSFIPLAAFAPHNTVTVSGMSKSYAMTGWRIGYLVGPSWIIKAAQQVNDAITFAAPTLSQVGAEYALRHHDELVTPIVGQIKERLRLLEHGLNNLTKFSVSPIGGSIYAFVDVRRTGFGSIEFANKLLEKERVLVVPGNAFGPNGEGFVRVAATQTKGKITEAINRFSQFC
ncbi:aminotransferase class I/II-fold pyridoxal phosphate-dependent enzyme [Limosilactobacillus vaginalis]|uniref:aminotransferase class I/II-fold pyridoxal phosphate-dependent enzyme n=1 Tax=Limosilactobacillus vaginalis TaxID=1633 RepID=UPI003AB42A89